MLAVIMCMLCCVQVWAQDTRCKSMINIPAMERSAAERRFSTGMRTAASTNYRVTFYRCNWQVDPSVRYIQGNVSAYFIVNTPSSSIVFDLVHTLTIDSVVYRHQKINFSQQDNETLTINFPQAIATGVVDSVTTYYKGVPGNTGFGSFIQDTHNGTPVMWTLSEPYGARDWWPCRNNVNDKTDSIDISISYPSIYKGSANGVLQSETTVGGITTSSFKHRYRIATYLVALAVTNYETFTDYVQLGTTSLPVVSYVYPEDKTYFVQNTAPVLDAMKLYHNTFAPYPFIKEKYGHTQFGWGGGMEHQTNTFIITPDKNLMAHELAHHWFGDKITCGSWQDIWLNEGFATFCANYFMEQTDPPFFQQLINDQLNSVTSQPGGSVWVDDTTSTDRIFDGRLSYDKGAYLLRMLRWTLGNDVFFAGIRQYQSDTALAYKTARTTDFKQHMEQASGKNLDYFFNQWYKGEGFPSFTVKWTQDGGNKAQINVTQTTSVPASISFFKVPLAITFYNATQQKTVVINCNQNNTIDWADIGFIADSILIDPDKQLLSKNNKAIHLATPLPVKALQVFPNPVKDQLTVILTGVSGGPLNVQLYAANGQVVWKYNNANPSTNETVTIPFAAFAKGIYILQVKAGNTIDQVQRILK